MEAFGDTRGRAGRCVMPADFLTSVGFKTQRAHATTPRMRMDLRTALSLAGRGGGGAGAAVGRRAAGPRTSARHRGAPHTAYDA